MWEKWIGVILLVGGISDICKRRVSFVYLTIFSSSILLNLILLRELRWYEWIGGGSIGMLFLLISKLTNEQIGYGDSWAILNLGIYVGIWRIFMLLSVAFTFLIIFSVLGVGFRKLKKDSRIPFYPFLFLGYIGVLWW